MQKDPKKAATGAKKAAGDEAKTVAEPERTAAEGGQKRAAGDTDPKKTGTDGDLTATVIAQTKKWIVDVVVGCNFCPFAAREVKAGTIHYRVETATELAACLQSLMEECARLDREETIATTIVIFPNAFQRFDDYLEGVALAEKLMKKSGYEGVYQVASFHPLYRFAKTKTDDPANYTNRSIYPMLHLLREEQVEKALAHYPDPGKIPADNIDFTRAKGEAYMRLLRESCM